MRKLSFLKALNSPFKPFKIKVYFGKTQIGTPYFYPRRWVKYTEADAIKSAKEAISNPKLAQRSFKDWVSSYRGYQKAVPKKIGFDFVELGWKTKWTDTDYRFEWAPRISFVFFGYQLALIVSAQHDSNYWEAWLYYERDTDKTKSKMERITQCREEFPQTFTSHWADGRKETIDYYELILREKYKNGK